MSNVRTGVLAKLQARLPDQIGPNARWSQFLIEALTVAADRATRDLCEVHRDSYELTLSDDSIYADVPDHFISIDKVEFALDGTNYDWLLQPMSMSDLDGVSHSWRTDRGARPDFYVLLSAPGIPDDVETTPVDVVLSKLMFYPALNTVGSAKLRITGVVVPQNVGVVTPYNSIVMPEDVQSKCLIPYILSVLYATAEPARAAEEYQKFKLGCETVRNRFRSQYADFPSRRGAYE